MSNEELKSIADEIQAAEENLASRLDTLFGAGAKDTDGAMQHLKNAHDKLMALVNAPAPGQE
jgi:hypothetical protein